MTNLQAECEELSASVPTPPPCSVGHPASCQHWDEGIAEFFLPVQTGEERGCLLPGNWTPSLFSRLRDGSVPHPQGRSVLWWLVSPQPYETGSDEF